MFDDIANPSAVRYLTCNACSVVLANGDDSHIPEEDLSSVTATVEVMGWVTYGDKFGGEYFRCYMCGYDDIAGHVWYGSH